MACRILMRNPPERMAVSLRLRPLATGSAEVCPRDRPGRQARTERCPRAPWGLATATHRPRRRRPSVLKLNARRDDMRVVVVLSSRKSLVVVEEAVSHCEACVLVEPA